MVEPVQENTADRKLRLAIGKSRHSTHWQNMEMTWQQLVKRLSETKYTGETLTEYMNLPKSRQDDIKDVGGFVGGLVKGGRRKVSNMGWRDLITLDMDFAPLNFAEVIANGLGKVTYLLYGTHKYRPDNPRIRIVIPLLRGVTPDEYQAISRRLAADIGMDFFDDTTYEPHRLMYWPSTPDDIEYYFKAYEGIWINPDKVLTRYENWQDQSQWPTSSRAFKLVKKSAERQMDPYEKRGLIGAFCRTYSIEAAMEKFLPGVYVKCDGSDDRFTYAGGTTSAGAIVYEGKFLYSHHSTDPCCEQLVNAFDMVRIHKFGNADDDVNPATPAIRRPSYLAMLELARVDGNVKKTLLTEKEKETKAEFEAIPDEDDEAWKAEAEFTKNGDLKKLPQNVILILRHNPQVAGKVVLDRFSRRIMVTSDLPWHKVATDGKWWGNADDSGLRNFLSKEYKIDGKGMIDDAFREVLQITSIHVVRDYLENLPAWDGVPRLDTLMIDYLGAEDTEFNRVVTRKAITAAVYRIMEPGCKFDYVLTLIGSQGLGKSYIWKRLGHGWTSDSVSTVTGKEAMEQIQGAWIIELAELAALRKSELEAVKQFITKQDDSFRPAYGREVEHYERQCVFVATTNEPDFIRDNTGGRRWWPVQVGVSPRKLSPFEDLTDSVVDQIWAEAVMAYTLDEPLYLDADMEEQARELQQCHTEESQWAGLIRAYVDKLLPENWAGMSIDARKDFLKAEAGSFDQPDGKVPRSKVCAAEIWVEVLDGAIDALSKAKAREINSILQNLDGWERIGTPRNFGPYGSQRGYRRATNL